MPIKEGLKQSLNQIREISSEIYHEYVPIIDDNTDIGTFGAPILTTPNIMNEFMSQLVNRIVYTRFENKYFRNPLQILEGDRIPLGYAGQEIYVNPAQGRKFNVDDFAGLLVKYEADVKVQYTTVNMDLQYPVTVSRHKLKQAFVSWESLDGFIAELSNSLYNGAYIDEYQFTKQLVSSSYQSNQVQVEQITAPTTEELAKEFITKARTFFLNFQTPSTNYNAWQKVGGSGRPVTTWTLPEDIVFLIRNDIRAYLDVNVLASAFNIDKSDLLGRILPVDNFDLYDETGKKVFDGSSIVGMIADQSWFRIKRQDMYLDEFYNANNRTWQYFLNLTKMYNYSLFSNAVVFATELPNIPISTLDFKAPEGITIEMGSQEGLDITVNPVTANTPKIQYASANSNIFTVQADENNDRHCILTPVAVGESNLTATAGGVTAQVAVTVKANQLRSAQTKSTSSK